MKHYIIFRTEEREVFVSKKEDLDNIDKCVNVAEGVSRAPAFYLEEDARRRCEKLNAHLEELKEGDEGDEGGLYRSASLYVSSSVEINRRKKYEALMLGSLGEFIDVEIKGNDVILTRDNRVFNDDDLDDEEENYIPSVSASIVDGILYIQKEFDIGNGYEPRVVHVSNQFTITIKEPENS